MYENLGMFFGVAAMVIMTPGQDTALTIRNTLYGGRPGGIGTAAGVATGQALWTLATSAGIAALLIASPAAFRAVKIAGAAYLVYRGAQSLIAALRGGAKQPGSVDRTASLPVSAAFGQGVLSNLGNPKIAVFFTSLLPQFVAAPSFVPLATLGFAFCLMTLVWLVLYTLAVERAGRMLRAPRMWRAVEGAMGVALAGIGIWVLAEAVLG